MKINQLKTYCILLMVLTSSVLARAANTTINWFEPEKYTDLGTNFHDDADIEIFSKQLEPYIQRMADKYLAPNTSLELTITDVDLAGEYEPWKRNDDVRIVRSIYPPRISLAYKLLDKDDKLIASGEESITDVSFDFNIGRRFHMNDEFFYEKELIGSWIRNELKNLESKK